MKFNALNKLAIFASLTLGLSSLASAQKEEPGEGGGGGAGIDCNGLGTAITNGTFYERTEPAPAFGGVNFIDPGLSINDSVLPTRVTTGVLAGSSMRVQVDPSTGNTTTQSTGVTTKASCVTTASLAIPTAGGSSRLFWDTGSGMNPPAGASYPYPITSTTATDGHSQFGCFQISGQTGGQNYYDFTYTLDFSDPTQVDGIYWESYVNHGGTKQLFVNGVLVTTTVNSANGTDIDSNGVNNSLNLQYNFMAINQSLSGTNNIITLRSIGADPVVGDFAVLGCCTPVPEPSTTLLLVGTFAASLLRRKRA